MKEIAHDLEFPEGPVALPDGSVILVEIARGTLSKVRTPRNSGSAMLEASHVSCGPSVRAVA